MENPVISGLLLGSCQFSSLVFQDCHLSFFQTKKKELFQAISVSPKRDTKNNNFELVLSRQICQRNHVLHYASEKGLDAK